MLHDVLIIGAGPCGLAVAAHLKEHTPSAIFTDEEHQRYHWINKHKGRMNLVRAHQGKLKKLGVGRSSPSSSGSSRDDEGSDTCRGASPPSSSSPSSSASSIPGYESKYKLNTGSERVKEERIELSMLILDSTGDQWMERWNRAFEALEIEQLRSPMFFHVDPGDRDGMLAYTTEHGREKELWEISGCVGKEKSKHQKKKKIQKSKQRNRKVIGDAEIDERDRKDYFSPGTGLFRDFCESVAARYGLDAPGLIKEREVVDVRYGYFEEDTGWSEKIFMVKTRNEEAFYARTVVLAVGPGGRKIMPFPLSAEEAEGACHSSEIRTFPSANVKKRIQQRRETNVVVVGGGLSSAQIVDMAVRKGVSKVWLLLRSDFKVKHFDITLSWMGKFKNYEKAVFWSADTDEERLEMIKTARNGGSITPRYQKILRNHAARGRVSIHPHTVISTKEYCSVSKTWRLVTDPPIPDLPAIDYIHFATGMHMDVRELPLLRQMHRDYPIESIQGLPCLTDDLMWQPWVPLFLTGRLAALRLGPGAPNLEGARLGAERIAWSMEEVLGPLAFGSEETDTSKQCVCGLGNRYAGLSSSTS
ncbi:FAD binding domain protein [Aspergillus lucknowensis]|uniref:L-ornithine N(5)-monooxygenase n=1 Tax=Aspergillus lucknowensis TaxID=176173 RepID=A0ABR4LUN9_9EURO